MDLDGKIQGYFSQRKGQTSLFRKYELQQESIGEYQLVYYNTYVWGKIFIKSTENGSKIELTISDKVLQRIIPIVLLTLVVLFLLSVEIGIGLPRALVLGILLQVVLLLSAIVFMLYFNTKQLLKTLNLLCESDQLADDDRIVQKKIKSSED